MLLHAVKQPPVLILALAGLFLNREVLGWAGEEEATSSSSSSSSSISATLSVVEEKPEDCKPNQFYYEPRATCRNCTDLNNLFHSYSEWLNQEVSSIHDGDALKVTTTTSSGNKYNNYDKSTLATTNLVRERPSRFGANGEVLSRLVSVAANLQDKEYLEEPSQDSGSNEYASDIASDSIRHETKQTQKLVARFIQSETMGNELLGTIEQCRQFQNVNACQMWSNMCVLSMYSYSDIPMQRGLESMPDYHWKNNNHVQISHSWQQCSQFNMNSICNSLREWSKIEKKSNSEMLNIYAADELMISKVVGGGFGLIVRLNQAIQLLAYKYSYDGKFIGVDQFGLDEMEKFCLLSQDLKSRNLDSNHIRLGRNMQLKCQFNSIQATSSKLLKLHNDTIFIDLYIGYQLNGALYLKPVPILIKNLLYNNDQINRKYVSDPYRWKLVHRFFFHTKYATNLDSVPPDNQNSVTLYAKEVVLDLTFKRQEKGQTLLSSILLTIDYDQITTSLSTLNYSNNQLNTNYSLHLNDELITEVRIAQTLLDMQTYKKDLDLIVTILGIISGIFALIKCYNTQKCFGIVKLDLDYLIRFILISCDTIGNLLAIISLSFVTFLFSTLKLQTNVQVLTPQKELETLITLNLQLAFLFKLIGLSYKFYIILNADIFFIDWEKPKMLTSGELLNHLSHYNKLNKEQGHDQVKSPQDKVELVSINRQSSSFWRPYTVVNRWCQLQTLRRHNITFQLFVIVCAMYYMEVTDYSLISIDSVHDHHQSVSSSSVSQHQAYQQRTSYQLTPVPCLTFKFLLMSYVYLLLSLAQLLYRKLFYESVVQDAIHEFIDLCSVANVSLFCMLYPRFGYYIHGRNANGFGDCGIAEMNALLEREERDLCSKRGLAPDCDQQAFTLILPKIINDHYKKLLFRDNFIPSFGQINSKQEFNAQASSGNSFLAGGNSLIRSAFNLSTSSPASFSLNRAAIETIVTRNKMINAFLTNFICHVYKDVDYSIRDKRRFESFLSNIDSNDEENSMASAARNGPLLVGTGGIGMGNLNTHQQHRPATLATFCKDPTNSFTSLLWLGHEWDLILVELLSLLMLELWLNQPLIITVTLVWLLHHSLRKLYISFNRHNLIAKALLDQKFMLR